jgi:hypothetical protein
LQHKSSSRRTIRNSSFIFKMDGSNLTYDGTELVTRRAIAADGIAHLSSIYLSSDDCHQTIKPWWSRQFRFKVMSWRWERTCVRRVVFLSGWLSRKHERACILYAFSCGAVQNTLPNPAYQRLLASTLPKHTVRLWQIPISQAGAPPVCFCSAPCQPCKRVSNQQVFSYWNQSVIFQSALFDMHRQARHLFLHPEMSARNDPARQVIFWRESKTCECGQNDASRASACSLHLSLRNFI